LTGARILAPIKAHKRRDGHQPFGSVANVVCDVSKENAARTTAVTSAADDAAGISDPFPSCLFLDH
jgi:hypothetical protein